MNSKIPRAVIVAGIFLFAGLVGKALAETLPLEEPVDIADALELQVAVDQLSEQVMACAEQEMAAPERCFCLYPAEVEKVELQYEVVLKRHPEWAEKFVYWTTDAGDYGYNISFPGLRRQLETLCE